MLVYRIERAKYVDSLLLGEGAKINGGRWNHAGTAVVYASESRSLALLEIIVHLKHTRYIPNDRMIVTIQLEDELITHLSDHELPTNWNTMPNGPTVNKDLIEQKLIKTDNIAIRVPSVVMPQEHNYIIKAQSIPSNLVTIQSIEKLEIDQRISH